uniref:EGF-like domain-containing protein n=1 Tax=Chromera velia CCMP2878 TaxID=1169474 RepID=A0A0G4I4I7_9ALVE|eukprot:Cvel_10913.t1-p1 / transcript=Cvel_10913.t1 / gene=Cvel_10913 / organism=Chromera_velia_CCMP2878 / gene_product=Fibrillin-1, putative / transcript_product=Fibrillin-1, putative / location=Cvel_scaffold670:37098-45196(+) / protein_length=836 / sequence_SO=supercontig / SO=protein_coding / is_pseudo=false
MSCPKNRVFFVFFILGAGWGSPWSPFPFSPGITRADATTCSYRDALASDGITCTRVDLLPPSDIGKGTAWLDDSSVQLNGEASQYQAYSGSSSVCTGTYRVLAHNKVASPCGWAFDRDVSTNWHSDTSGTPASGTAAATDATEELWLWLPCRAYIYWYAVRSRSNYDAQQTPSAMDVYGSTDQITDGSASWTLIGSYSNDLFTLNQETKFFSIDNSSTAWSAVRFHMKRISKAADDWMSVAEIWVWGDADECLSSLHDCHSNAACTNTVDSFTCACNAGYSGDGITACANVDECSTNVHNCASNVASCADSTGSFSCSCNAGYSGDGVTCSNEDECSSGTHTCPSISACVNTPGGFECQFPETLEVTLLETEATEDEGAAANVQTMEALRTLTSSKPGDAAAVSRADAADTVDTVAVKVRSALSLASSSGRKLSTEESKSITEVLVTAGESLSNVFQTSQERSRAASTEEDKDAQTKAATTAVGKLAESLSETVSLSTPPAKNRAGRDTLKATLPVLSSLESVPESAAWDAGVSPGAAGSSAFSATLRARRADLHSATEELIKVATSSLGPQVLLQAGSGGASELSTDSFTLSAASIGSFTDVADAGRISAVLGGLSVTIPDLPMRVRGRLRELAGSCDDSETEVLGLVAVGWGGDIRSYVGGERRASGSRSLRLFWCGREVGREVFQDGDESITVGIQGIGEGAGGRRRLQEEEGEAGCASFDENEAEWSSLCSATGGEGCECVGAGASLMETEYGSFVSDLLGVATGADLSVIWQVERFGEGARVDNIALWLVVLLVGALLTHLLMSVGRSVIQASKQAGRQTGRQAVGLDSIK